MARANLELRNRVKELEAQLAAPSQTSSQAQAAPSQTSSQAQDSQLPDEETIVNDNLSEADTTPLQPLNSSYSDAPTMATRPLAPAPSNAQSPVDVLAAGVFDHPSAGHICYFGSTSNHALFWSLTASIANLGHRSSSLYQEPLRQRQVYGDPARLPIPADSSVPNYCVRDSNKSPLPARVTAVRWINCFFDTIGAILPYVSEPALIDSLDALERTSRDSQPSGRANEALLNIVFAHALSTVNEDPPETYYRRTLGLLDPKTLYVSSLSLLQALLLLSIYQQNSQRSTESWTTHSLAVKTSYQLGIHSPSLYEFVSVHEKELRSRLWFAVVNQDRMLSTALGQPCLVPSQHVRMGMTDMLATGSQSRTVEMSYSRENLTYFRHLMLDTLPSLHEIMGTTMDSIHGSNISPSNRLALTDLVAKTLDLSLKLSQWRNTNLPSRLIGSDVDFSTWASHDFDAARNTIIISIFYYRTMMLIHGSLLMFALELATNLSPEIAPTIVQDTIQSLLKNDYAAVTEFHNLIRGIFRNQQSFLKNNAIWWTCNYAALTLCLHLFGFWVASNNRKASFMTLGMESSELEAQLRECLDTLKAIGVSSAMSVKAHRCLQRHLHFLTNSPSATGETSRPSVLGRAGPDRMRDYHGPQFIPGEGQHPIFPADLLNPAVEWFGDLSVEDFIATNPLGIELGVSDFDAAGLI
ncbi:Fc.00g115400.m01.CDS01 [Cosmosporella sp. VM-42]